MEYLDWIYSFLSLKVLHSLNASCPVRGLWCACRQSPWPVIISCRSPSLVPLATITMEADSRAKNTESAGLPSMLAPNLSRRPFSMDFQGTDIDFPAIIFGCICPLAGFRRACQSHTFGWQQPKRLCCIWCFRPFVYDTLLA